MKWRDRKTLCAGAGCHNMPRPRKPYCRPCHREMVAERVALFLGVTTCNEVVDGAEVTGG